MQDDDYVLFDSYRLLELSFSLCMEYDALVKLLGIVYAIADNEHPFHLYSRIRGYLKIQPAHFDFNYLHGGEDEIWILTNLDFIDMQLHTFNFSRFNRWLLSEFVVTVNSFGMIDTLISRLEDYLDEEA